MGGTFEFDQPYKQTESKMQACVTVGMHRRVTLCKQKKRRWHTGDTLLANSINGTARCLLTLKNMK